MKTLKLLGATLLTVVMCFGVSSCKYDDSDLWDYVKDLSGRVSVLEELCKKMNTNISSMQVIVNAQETGDYVTGVVPIVKDGKTIGYTITFKKNSPITIYNGEDGQKGKDGYTPSVTIAKDTDGNYYWKVDGNWLLASDGTKVRANGTDGQDGITPQMKISDGYWYVSYDKGATWTKLDKAVGENGGDGVTPQFKIEDGYWYVSYDKGATWTKQGKATGENGGSGNDGITPQFKITDDYWYVSYDKGATWTKLGKATGENGGSGNDGVTPQLKIVDDYWYISYDKGTTWTKLGKATGEKGSDGDSMFSSVTVGTDSVTFVTTDGTTITLPMGSGTANSVNGHEYVDLGLPSGTLWATTNVGASDPEDFGGYYAWGETKGLNSVKTGYIWSTYKFNIGGNEASPKVSKYCLDAKYGSVDDKSELDLEDDVAYVNWGTGWRTPTFEQIKELTEECTWNWVEINGVTGMKVVGNNSNYIFLPAASYKGNNYTHSAGSNAYYWSRTLFPSNSGNAYVLSFSSSNVYTLSHYRWYGLSVRPVLESE